MQKGKEEKVEETPENPPTETPTEPQTPTFTQEQLDTAKEEVRQGELTKYQGIQRTVSKKDLKIADLEGQVRELSAPSDLGDDSSRTLEILLQDRKSKASESGESDPMIPVLEADIANRKRAVQMRKQKVVTDQKWQEFEQKIVDADLDPEDEGFDSVRDAFNYAKNWDGDFGEAERRLNRVLKKAGKGEGVKEPEGKKETEDEKVERLANKKFQEELEERGLLKTEPGKPSASSLTRKDIIKRYAEGDPSVSRKDYEKAMES